MEAMEIPLIWILRKASMEVKRTVTRPLFTKAAPVPPTLM